MSPYREPPPQFKPAPKAPWYRVALAILTRRLLGRLRAREWRTLSNWCPPLPEWARLDRERLIAVDSMGRRLHPPPMPLPGPGKNVSM